MIIFIVIGVIVGILGILIWHIIDKFQIATDSKEKWKSSYGEIYKGISYGEKASNVFDLYIPANADNASIAATNTHLLSVKQIVAYFS